VSAIFSENNDLLLLYGFTDPCGSRSVHGRVRMPHITGRLLNLDTLSVWP